MKKPTARSEEFLRLFRRYGSGLTLGQFCRRQGFAQESVEKWLADTEGFKDAYEAILAEHSGSPTTTAVGLMKFGLTEDQATFLANFRESHDRMTALAQSGWSSTDLINAQKNPVFAEEMDLIRLECRWLVEDSLMRKAGEGSVGHQKFWLEAEVPERYAKKVNHRLSGNVQFTPKAALTVGTFWSKRLSGQVAAPAEEKKADENADVVDAEYAEVGKPN